MSVRGIAPSLVAVAAVAAGCNDTVTVRPIIDLPMGDRSFEEVETIELSVALDGEAEPILSTTFRRGETLELPGVPYGEDLVVHMLGRVSTSEVAYGRTCAFAVHAGEPPPQPHLYFARTVRWARSATPPNAVRIGGRALTSRNGSALYLGGLDVNNVSLLGADRFNPTTARFDELAMLAPRRFSSTVSLGDGRAILVGGVGTSDQVEENIDLISIDAVADQAVQRIEAKELGSIAAPALATLNDGSVVAIGGIDRYGRAFDNVSEILVDGSLLTVHALPRATLTYPRYGHTATRLSDDLGAPVLIAGGRSEGGTAVKFAELYRPLVQRIAPATEFSPEIRVARWDHAAVRLPDGSVLIIGGRNELGPVASIEVFTIETGFTLQGILPPGSGLTEFSVTPLPDGRVLIAGGRDASGEPVADAHIVRIDPFGGGIDIVSTDRLSVPRAGHQATLLCDGTVLLVGGTPSPSPAERYNPPSSGRR